MPKTRNKIVCVNEIITNCNENENDNGKADHINKK